MAQLASWPLGIVIQLSLDRSKWFEVIAMIYILKMTFFFVVRSKFLFSERRCCNLLPYVRAWNGVQDSSYILGDAS